MQFSSISATIDSEGNMKLFASLEKMSEEQQERFEKVKERLAEQKDQADETEEETKKEPEVILAKSADVEADNAEELLKKIFEIDWSNIDEEEFIF